VKRGEQKKKRERRWSPSTEPWQSKMENRVFGTVQDAAHCIDVPPSFIYTHWRILPGAKKIGRYLRFDLSELSNARYDGVPHV